MAIHSPTLIPTSCVTQHTARWERDTWGCAQSTFVWVDGTVYAGAGTTEVSDASLWWDGGKTKVWTEVGCIPHTLRHSANTAFIFLVRFTLRGSDGGRCPCQPLNASTSSTMGKSYCWIVVTRGTRPRARHAFIVLLLITAFRFLA